MSGYLTDYPYGVSSFGVPVLGSPGLLTTGKFFFVDSQTGVDSPNRGLHPTRCAATVAYTLANLVRPNKGDIVLVLPGHAENITAAGTITAKAGVKVIGLGVGSNRPTFTFTTVNTATITVNAANFGFENCIFDLTGVAALAAGWTVTAAEFFLSRCLVTQANSTNQGVLGVSLGANANRVTIENCEWIANTAGATAAIQGVVAADRLNVLDCIFNGDTTAFIRNTTVAWTRANILRNYFYNLGSGKSVIVDAATTGFCAYNTSYVAANIAAGGSITAAGMLKAQNFAQEAAGIATSAVVDPATQAIT